MANKASKSTAPKSTIEKRRIDRLPITGKEHSSQLGDWDTNLGGFIVSALPPGELSPGASSNPEKPVNADEAGGSLAN